MGTTKSGRLLNTRGAAGTASQFSVVHSNEGAYTKPQKNGHIRLKSGGHGQVKISNMLVNTLQISRGTAIVKMEWRFLECGKVSAWV